MIFDVSIDKAEAELESLGEDLDNSEAREIIQLRVMLRILYALEGIRSAIISVGAKG